MTNAAVAGIPLEERLERIAQHIVRAGLFLDLWFYFEEHDSRQKIIETMEDYNEFFRFTPHAYLVTYLVYMAGTFETRHDTINLTSLVRETKAKGALGGQEEAALMGLMTSAKPIAKKVAILRNNAIAHRASSMSYDEAFRQANITPFEFRHLTELALNVANILLLSCGRRDQHFTDMPRKAAAEMMAALAARHTNGT